MINQSKRTLLLVISYCLLLASCCRVRDVPPLISPLVGPVDIQIGSSVQVPGTSRFRETPTEMPAGLEVLPCTGQLKSRNARDILVSRSIWNPLTSPIGPM